MTAVILALDSPHGTGNYEVWLAAGGQAVGGVNVARDATIAPLVAYGALDATGSATVDLEPTSLPEEPEDAILPTGAVYRVRLRATASPTWVQFHVAVPAIGPVEAVDLMTDEPETVASVALSIETAARVAADLDVRADLQEIIDALTLEAGAVSSVNGRAGIVTGLAEQADLDDEEAAREQADADHAATPHGGDVSQQDLDDHATAEATARGLAIATAIAALIDSSPALLDTLNELAAALGDDPNFAATITALIGTKETPAGAQAKANAAQAAAIAASQPVNSDLSAIALLGTTAYGRALLTLANDAALLALLGPTGTPTAGTYLRGDGTWSTPAGDVARSETSADVFYAAANAATIARPTGFASVHWYGQGTSVLPTNMNLATDLQWTMPAPTTGAATATPAAISTPVTIGAPSLSTGSRVAAAVISTAVTIPSPSVVTSEGTTVTPAAIATPVTIPSPVVGTGSTVAPAVIATAVTIASPTVTTGGGANATPVHLTTSTSNTDATLYQTASVTTPGGQASLIGIAPGGTSPTLPTVVQNGHTWDHVGTVSDGTSTPLYVFRAAPASPVTGTIDITFGTIRTGCAWTALTVTDSIGTSNGAGALGTLGTAAQTSGSSITATVPALANARSALVSFVRAASAATPTVGTGGAGFTLLGTASQSDPGRIGSQWQQNVVSADWQNMSTTVQRTAAVEVKAV